MIGYIAYCTLYLTMLGTLVARPWHLSSPMRRLLIKVPLAENNLGGKATEAGIDSNSRLLVMLRVRRIQLRGRGPEPGLLVGSVFPVPLA